LGTTGETNRGLQRNIEAGDLPLAQKSLIENGQNSRLKSLLKIGSQKLKALSNGIQPARTGGVRRLRNQYRMDLKSNQKMFVESVFARP
jgi:hypothetical protein